MSVVRLLPAPPLAGVLWCRASRTARVRRRWWATRVACVDFGAHLVGHTTNGSGSETAAALAPSTAALAPAKLTGGGLAHATRGVRLGRMQRIGDEREILHSVQRTGSESCGSVLQRQRERGEGICMGNGTGEREGTARCCGGVATMGSAARRAARLHADGNAGIALCRISPCCPTARLLYMLCLLALRSGNYVQWHLRR